VAHLLDAGSSPNDMKELSAGKGSGVLMAEGEGVGSVLGLLMSVVGIGVPSRRCSWLIVSSP
jgi:hypothetical protein